MPKPRFDVIYYLGGVHLDYHFCRNWDEDGGCCGTNPDHGFTFEEAKKQVVKYHEEEAESWNEKTYDDWANYDDPVQESID